MYEDMHSGLLTTARLARMKNSSLLQVETPHG